MPDFIEYLKGGDLRSIAEVDQVVAMVKTQEQFDQLLGYLFSEDRLIAMRAADAIEKISLRSPEYLKGGHPDIINLITTATNKELKWHLALIVSRLDLTTKELEIVWNQLTNWATDKNESRIVRVNSIQTLYDLTKQNEELKLDFDLTIQEIETENIPSINARLRKLKSK